MVKSPTAVDRADVKSAVGSLAKLLALSVPVLIALLATAATIPADVSFAGATLPRVAAVYLMLGFDGLLMWHAARLNAVLIQKVAAVPAARDAITSDTSLLNPYFSAPSEAGGMEGFFRSCLMATPRLSVGFVLGFHMLLLFAPATSIPGPLVQLAWIAVLLHLGNPVATLSIGIGLRRVLSWRAVAQLAVSYLAGLYAAYKTVVALGY